MAQAKNGQNNGGSKALGAGMGLAALAAAAAGAYYFYGSKNAGKNRKALKGWAVKARGEVMERMENLKDVSQGSYEKVVSQVMDKYKRVKNIDAAELAALTAELRSTWNRIAKEVKGPVRKAPAKKTKSSK